MTIAQIHALVAPPAARRLARTAAIAVGLLILSGCLMEHHRTPSPRLSPYSESNPVIWGVAPLRNESGTSVVDELYVTDLLVNEIQQVPGIDALPTSRTIAAMSAIGIRSIDSPEQARSLARSLGVDALLVGTITAYDPYDPPTLGLSMALFAGSSPQLEPYFYESGDPLAFPGQSTEAPAPQTSRRRSEPLSALSDVVDAADGGVRARIRRYADGRHDPSSALAWQRYVKSMDLFAKFVCFDLVGRLLELEQVRLSRIEAGTTTAAAP